MKTPVSHPTDLDSPEAPLAQLHAARNAPQLAEQTGTRFVVRRAATSALNL